jgi:TonB family protein
MTRILLAIAALLFLGPLLIPAQTPTPAKASALEVQPVPYKVGGDVLPPKLVHSVEPKLHLHRSFFHSPKSCDVLVRLTVTVDGVPSDVHTIRSCNAAFDKSATEAVSQYRFDPSTLRGKAVPVLLNVEVRFNIY